MRHFYIDKLSFSQIQMFIESGNVLSYTKAAEICHVSQPTISRNINLLEDTMGLILFTQNGRNLQFTPAGRYLHNYLKNMIEQLETEIARTHELQAGNLDKIRIAFPSGINFEKLMRPCIECFQNNHQQYNLKYTLYNDFQGSLHDLLTYQTDVIITFSHLSYYLDKSDFIEWNEFVSPNLAAFMLRTNPLSFRRTVDITELSKQKLILPSFSLSPDYVNFVLKLFQEKGIIPQVSQYINTTQESLLNLTQDDEILISDQFLSYDTSRYVYVNINDKHSGMLIIWRKSEETDNCIYKLVSFIKNYFALRKDEF